MSHEDILQSAAALFSGLSEMERDDKIECINGIREILASYSPFKSEPVDFIRWVRTDRISANDYNPNSVAPPEMELLRLSIMADGYTQPIVTNLEGDGFEVVDGFHRTRVAKECPDIKERVFGYAPIVQIKTSQAEKPDRMASTIRHNRARGKHRVDAMSDIVLELKRRNWSNEKIGKQLGMDPDEVLRLTQISGLADAWKDRAFSEAWEADESMTIDEDDNLNDEIGPEIHQEGVSSL